MGNCTTLSILPIEVKEWENMGQLFRKRLAISLPYFLGVVSCNLMDNCSFYFS